MPAVSSECMLSVEVDAHLGRLSQQKPLSADLDRVVDSDTSPKVIHSKRVVSLAFSFALVASLLTLTQTLNKT